MGIERSEVEQVINGLYEGESITKQLRGLKINVRFFYEALHQYPDLHVKFTRARLAYADKNADEIIDIADTDPDPQKARNRIDARKWLASKLKPEVYGDRIDLNVNQVVDIRGVLERAKQRALRPTRDLIDSPKVEVIEITETKLVGSTDQEPDARDSRDAKKIPEEDIFS